MAEDEEEEKKLLASGKSAPTPPPSDASSGATPRAPLLQEADLSVALEVRRLLMAHSAKAEAFVWTPVEAGAPAAAAAALPELEVCPDMTAPTLSEWLSTELEGTLASVVNGALRVLPPLRLKGRVMAPALVLHPDNRTVCVYTGKPKGVKAKGILYDPLLGTAQQHDVDGMWANQCPLNPCVFLQSPPTRAGPRPAHSTVFVPPCWKEFFHPCVIILVFRRHGRQAECRLRGVVLPPDCSR